MDLVCALTFRGGDVTVPLSDPGLAASCLVTGYCPRWRRASHSPARPTAARPAYRAAALPPGWAAGGHVLATMVRTS
jgi:hypothetical protein